MKNIKSIIALLSLTACMGISISMPSYFNNDFVPTNADTKTFEDDQFISVDNFLYSSLGLEFKFSVDLPDVNKTNKFCFIQDQNGWLRLTNYVDMSIKTTGEITVSKGKIFFEDGYYYYQLMFKDLQSLLNTNEGATGHETLNMMYFNSYNIPLNDTTSSVIECDINASSKVEVRDGAVNGLRFKSHIPYIESGYTYGHIIVPNYYVAKYNDDFITHLEDDSRNYLNIPCSPSLLDEDDDLYKIYGSGYSISSSITNIKVDNYQLDFVAIPYKKSSSGVIKYGCGINKTKTNLYDVCLSTKNSEDYDSYSLLGKTYIDNVITTCENHPNVATELEHVKAYSVYNSEVILKDAAMPISPNKKVVISAARNESEGAQIILNSSINSDYFVNFEPFVKSDNSSRIEVSNVKAYKQLYQHVDSIWSEYYKVQNDAYINGAENLPFGWFPDALLPFNLAINSWENKLDTTNGNNNGIYFTIDVPSDIPAGLYKSKAIIRIVNEGTIVMPIELTVYDFTLPGKNHSNMTATINTQQLGYLYKDISTGVGSAVYKSAFELLADNGVSGGQLPCEKWSKADLPSYIETVKKYTLDDRVSVFYYPDCYQLMSVKVEYQYKQIVSRTKTVNLENKAIYVGKDYIYDEGGSNIPMYGIETLFTELVKASTSSINLLEKGIFYFPQADEPGKNEVSQVQNILCQNVVLKAAENVLKNESLFVGKPDVKKSLENVAYIVTSQPRGLLKGKVVVNNSEISATLNSITPVSDNCDLAYITGNKDSDFYKDTDGNPLIHMRGYCPQFDCFQYFKGGDNKYGYQDLMNMLNNDEYTIWWYGCCMPVAPFAVNFTNAPLIRYRVNKWLEYSLGIKGQLYYMCNRTSAYKTTDSGDIEIPLTEEEILAGKTTYNGIYGDGVLIYPVHNMYKDIDKNLYWLSSLKLVNWGEGNDDYNYLCYLDELINKLPSEEQIIKRNLVKEYIAEIASGPYYLSTDHGKLYEQKENIAKLIVELEG